MDTFTVAGPDISTAWIRACQALLQVKSHRGYHTVVRIGPDGKPVFQCAHGTVGVQHSLRQDQPIRSAQEEK